jgi:hypothetical protein
LALHLLVVGVTSVVKLAKRGVKLSAWLTGLMARFIWALLMKGEQSILSLGLTRYAGVVCFKR